MKKNLFFKISRTLSKNFVGFHCLNTGIDVMRGMRPGGHDKFLVSGKFLSPGLYFLIKLIPIYFRQFIVKYFHLKILYPDFCTKGPNDPSPTTPQIDLPHCSGFFEESSKP